MERVREWLAEDHSDLSKTIQLFDWRIKKIREDLNEYDKRKAGLSPSTFDMARALLQVHGKEKGPAYGRLIVLGARAASVKTLSAFQSIQPVAPKSYAAFISAFT